MANAAPVIEYNETLVAAEANASLALEEWRSFGRRLAKGAINRQWEIGEWLLAGEQRFQKKAYSEALAIFRDYSRATLRNIASVAKQVPVSLRNDSLTWNHHVAVAKFKPEHQKEWLERAMTNNWSSKKLRALIEEKSSSANGPNQTRPDIHPHLNIEQRENLECLARLHATTVSRLITRIVLEWLERPEISAQLLAAKGGTECAIGQ